MGVVIRQSFITSALTFLGAIIGYFNVLWLYPMSFNDTTEMGLFRVIQDTAILLVPFAQFGLSTTLIKFFPHFKPDPEKSKVLVNNFLWVSLFGYAFFLAVYFLLENQIVGLFAKNSAEVIEFMHIALALVFILVVSGIIEAYSRSLLKIVFPNFLREVLIRLLSGLIVALYFCGHLDMEELMQALVGVYAIALIALSGYLIYIKAVVFRLDFSIFDKAMVRQIVNYCLFAILSSSSGLIVMKIDSIMVASFLGLDQNAIYTTAFFIAVIIELPRRSVSQIMSPLIADNFKQEKLSEIKSLYQKSSINLFIIGLLIFIGIVANLDQLYYLIPKWQVFAPGKFVVLIIGVAKVFDMLTGVNSEIIIMSKYYRFNIIAISSLAVLTIITNSFLIPIYGLYGAAYASLISIVLFNTVKLLFIWAKFDMIPFTIQTIKVLLIGIAVYYLSTLLPHIEHPIVMIATKSMLMTLVYGSLVLVLNVSKEANQVFKEFLKRLGLRNP